MPPTRSLTFLFLLLGILSPPCPLSLTGRSLSAGPGPPWLALSAGSCSLICPAVPSLLTLIIRVHGGIALWDSLPRSPRSPAWPAEDATLLGVDFRQYAGRWSVAVDEIRRAPSLRGHSVPRLEHSGTSPQASDTRLRLYKRWCGLQGRLQGAGRVPLPWAEACVPFSWEGSEGWGGGLGVGSPGRRSSVCRGPGMSGGQDSGAEVGIWGNT